MAEHYTEGRKNDYYHRDRDDFEDYHYSQRYDHDGCTGDSPYLNNENNHQGQVNRNDDLNSNEIRHSGCQRGSQPSRGYDRSYDKHDYGNNNNHRDFRENSDKRPFKGPNANYNGPYRSSLQYQKGHFNQNYKNRGYDKENNFDENRGWGRRDRETSKAKEYYAVEKPPKDHNLPADVQKDPRGDDPTQRITKKASNRGAGRNTESFDPASTLVRPDVRVHVGSASAETFKKELRHDDVVIVPELFGPEDKWDIYYKLIKELTDIQRKDANGGSDFISWHEGAHLICKKPENSETFKMVIDRLCQYFQIDASSAGTRFNWYKDGSDWKPHHHDSAAFNPRRAKAQNITVGVSFGATRELAFIRADSAPSGHPKSPQEPVRMYFPQTNNGVFTFGRDVNIKWKHGVNALPPEKRDGKGRISIILWGKARSVIDEEGSPPLLGSNGHGPHANHNSRHHHRGGNHFNRNGPPLNTNNHFQNKRRRTNHGHHGNFERNNNYRDGRGYRDADERYDNYRYEDERI